MEHMQERERSRIQPGNVGWLRTQAPAKINLTLDVLGSRVDGYHEIRSFAIGVGLYDTLRATASSEPEIRVYCNYPGIKEADNLAFRAARTFQQSRGTRLGMTLNIEKNIPLGAGLGGGSSDAAASLRICDAIWQAGRTTDDLARLGASLGSDVPLFFHLPAVKVTGRGENVTAVSLAWKGWVVLILPPLAISTEEAYRARDEEARAPRREPKEGDILSASNARELSAMLSNGLQDAAFRVCPKLRELSESLVRRNSGPVHMTGSGAALFRLFDDPDEAESEVQRIQNELHVAACVVEAPVGMSPLVSEER